MFLRRDTASEIFYHKRTFYDCLVPTGFLRRDTASEIFYTFMIAVSLQHSRQFFAVNPADKPGFSEKFPQETKVMACIFCINIFNNNYSQHPTQGERLN